MPASPNDPLPTAAPLEVRDVVLDPVFGKRRDALLRTVPVHDLVDRARRVDPGYADFDVRSLALAAFDAVIARQGFPDRATPEQVITLLAGIARVQDPTAGSDACSGIAEHVLDGLTNRRERERQFSLHSIVYAAGDGGEILATSVPRPFWLLREQEDAASGEVYLEASSDAVNALVGGLDIPIEDQQTALELILERQLARGDLDSAHLTAEKARRLTVGYIAQTDELLAETERFLPGTDWKVAAPGLIEAALTHLDECLQREGRLLEHVAAGREGHGGDDPRAAQRARVTDRLTKLLDESRRLHTSLMERLIGARLRFLDAQDAQMFRPPVTIVEIDLAADLLAPALGLHLRDVEEVLGEYLRGTLGPVAPTVLNWGDLVDALRSPPKDEAPPADPDDTELEFRPDPAPLVGPDVLAATHRLLAGVRLPARLSTLIAACPDTVDDGAHPSDLLAAAALRGYDNATHDPIRADAEGSSSWPDDDLPAAAVGTQPAGASGAIHLLDVLGHDAACYADGLLLEGPGWSGDDLIVCADHDQLDAILLGDLPAPAATRLPERTPRGAA